MANTSEINVQVALDDNKVPESINWQATDSEGGLSHAIMLGIWDPKTAHTLKIDLWTKEMTVDDMKRFFHQSLLTMADTFERATNEHEMATDMRDFSRYFGEQMGLIPRQGH